MAKSVHYSILLTVALGLMGRNGSFQQSQENLNPTRASSQRNEEVIERFNQNMSERVNRVNLRLREVFSGKIGDNETQIARLEAQVFQLASELWSILDGQVVFTLDRYDRLPVAEINKALEVLLRTTPTLEEGGWSARIELYSAGTPNSLLAKYENWFQLGNLVSTLRVLKKVHGHWQVIGRMEDTALVTNQWPQHREELTRLLKERDPINVEGYPDTWWQKAQVIASVPIHMNGLDISIGSIQQLETGSIRFISVHIVARRIATYTLIQWEWTSSRGLEAVAWVWGDEWTYDEKIKSDVATWHSLDKSKNGKPVRLQDYVGQ
ncbi:MAG: hypothetical protein QXD59_05565 [Candidatus Caldarchaeum sp.]